MQARSARPPQAFHPDRIGPYEVLRRLGAGAMGEVFLARSASSRLVAVKTIRAGLAEHPGYRRRFAHEVDAARRVSGAFTAAVVGADPHADLPWLATVYVPAPSLEELVAECGPLAVSAVRWLAAGCAEALECVHRAGLVHRDFKPANVLVTADGPRVIDFGLARTDGLPQGTVAGMVLGTPLYMAPEQAAGTPATGPAADVFALGATLYHAATGTAPYREADVAAAVRQLVREPPDLGPVPAELHDLLLACMALAPDDRPAPAALIRTLSPYLASGDAPPLPEPVLEYIEDYRRAQLELTRSLRSRSAARTVVVDGDYAADHDADHDDDPKDDDPRPRHPSVLPPSALTNRRRAHSRSRRSLGPAFVMVGVICALGGATLGALLISGAMRPSDGDRSQQANTGPASGLPQGQRPPQGQGQGPPPGQGPPQGPPPGAVTEVNGVRLGVRPPFGDPQTTYVLNGSGWPPGQTVTVTFVEAAVPPVRTVVDGGGDFGVALDKGAGAVVLPDGRYHVRAASGALTETVSFVVGPPLTP
jgi:serine/threonine protein kinase